MPVGAFGSVRQFICPIHTPAATWSLGMTKKRLFAGTEPSSLTRTYHSHRLTAATTSVLPIAHLAGIPMSHEWVFTWMVTMRPVSVNGEDVSACDAFPC